MKEESEADDSGSEQAGRGESHYDIVTVGINVVGVAVTASEAVKKRKTDVTTEQA